MKSTPRNAGWLLVDHKFVAFKSSTRFALWRDPVFSLQLELESDHGTRFFGFHPIRG